MKIKYLFIALLCLFPVLAKAQEPFMRQLTTKDGLPQQQVMCYFKDSRGFVWLGTKNGLSRYDGRTFKNFGEEDGIPNNIVRNIGEDENGDIWFTTILGIVRFDGKKFEVHRNETLGDASMTIVNSHKIFIHSKDWILWENGRYISHSDYFKGIDITHIKGTFYDKPTGNIYVEVGDKLVVHLYKEGKLEKIGPPNLDLSYMQRTSNGDLFFGRYTDNSLIGFNSKIWRLEVYKQNTNGTLGLAFTNSNNTFNLFEPVPYQIYAGSFMDKPQFYIPKGQKGIFKTVTNPIMECPFELGANYEIHSCNFYASESDRIWVNSGQGMWQVFNDAFELIKNQDLNFAWAVTEDKKKNLLFSTFATGSIIQYDGKQFKTIFDKKSNPRHYVGFYFGASNDRQGNAYFPHHLGILKYDGQQFSQLLDEIIAPNGTAYYETSFYDKERNWLLAGGDHHIMVFDLSKNTRRTITPKEGLQNSETTEGIVKDNDGSLWLFGKQEISHWQPEANTFKNYSIINNRKLAFGGISGCIDSRGTFWLGNTFGLCYFDRQKDVFQWLTTELKHYITAVANYDKDHIIFGTADGSIYFLDLNAWYTDKKIALKLFNNNNGYPGGKIQQNGIFKDSKGDFWILSATGLVRLHPEKLNLNQGELPKAYIKQIDTFSFHLNHRTDTIQLECGQNYFTVEAGLLFFDPSVKTYFSYRLHGQSDTTWSAWTELSNNLFTGLATGVYTLEVKARPLGSDETKIDSIFIKVDLPLWKEPWFWKLVLSGLLLFLSIIAFLWFRNWYLGRQLRKNMESVRRLEVQTLQAQMNPHFVYNILGSMQNVIYQNDAKAAEFLLLRLSKLIRSFLEASVKSSNLKNLNTQNDTTLQEEIELLKLYIEFEQFVRKDKFTYDISVAADIDVGNFTLPPIIIQPYVENAIKHGIFYKEGKGHLSLNFYKQDEETLICEIMDDGVGIEQAKAMQAKSIKSYKSLSTQLILDRIERLNLMGYAIDVTTEERAEGGTKVRITFAYSKD